MDNTNLYLLSSTAMTFCLSMIKLMEHSHLSHKFQVKNLFILAVKLFIFLIQFCLWILQQSINFSSILKLFLSSQSKDNLPCHLIHRHFLRTLGIRISIPFSKILHYLLVLIQLSSFPRMTTEKIANS